MIYIGIDPSITNTGVVMVEGRDIKNYSIVWKDDKYKIFQGKRPAETIIAKKTKGEDVRLRAYEYALSFIKDNYFYSRSCIVAYERPMGANITSAYLLGMVYSLALMFMVNDYRTEKIFVYTPPELKKFATGKGNAKKELILQQVYKRWGVEFDDHNLADAFVLAKMAEADYNKTNNP